MTTQSETFASILLPTVQNAGFECSGYTPASKLKVNAEVRSMCAANRCRSYDKNWMCPPTCGTLETYSTAIGKRSTCIVVQTVATLEDEFDIEGMIEAERLHKERFASFVMSARAILEANQASHVSEQQPTLPLSAGACTVCPSCSYPESPCRNPEKAFVSMEAAGLLVSDVCEAAGIPYFHGKGTLAYTSCLLV